MRRSSFITSALVAGALVVPGQAQAVSPDVVISEVYGGGGNSGATLTNDFIELYNRGSAPVDLSDWSVQYASAAGTFTNRTDLTGTIAPGAHYLVQEGAGSGGTTPLPDPDDSGSIAMSATAGKVALATTQTNLACGSSAVPCSGLNIRDLVGYGAAASSFEGAPAPGLSNSTSASRDDDGTDTDNNAADFTAGEPSPINSGGGEEEPPAEPARIHDVQGAGHVSPLTGRRVSVPGVVTAVSGSGVWIQDPQPDDDPRTSEGLLVFGGRGAAVGDHVIATGDVTEFRPGGDEDNLSTTEVVGSVAPDPDGAGTITPTLIGPGGLKPPTSVIEDDVDGDAETEGQFDPSEDGLDFHESLEGMLVSIASPRAAGPTNGFGELSVVPEGIGGPFTARGGIYVTPEDFNPERLILDDPLVFNRATGAEMPALNTGDGLHGPVEAVVDYSFGNFKYLVTSVPKRIDRGLQREVTDAPRANQLAIASMNVENLAFVNPQEKFDELAGIAVENLRSPDILAVEEIQDDNGQTDDETTDASLTYQRLIAAIVAAGGPRYEYRQIDPVDDQDGGAPGGNIRVGFLYRSDRGLEFVDRPGGTPTTSTGVLATRKGARLTASPGRIDPTDPAFDDSRKPLAAEFLWKGRTVFAIANHFNSKGGDQPLFGRYQPPGRASEEQRHEQAAIVGGFVEQILDADPRAAIAVMGDFNDFQFSETLGILEDAGLTNLMKTLPENEQYSYVFDGNSQVLDQILVSRELLTPGPEYDSVHVNAEFADQASDHDPQVARVVVRGTGNANGQ